MARRHGKPRKNLSQWLALAPWWFSILLALSAYIGMRYLLPPLLDNGEGEGDYDDAATLVHFLAPYIAALLLVPVPFALFKREEHQRRVENERHLDVLRDLELNRFSERLADGFLSQGYGIEGLAFTGPKFDMILRRGGEKTIVVCKTWRNAQVSMRYVRAVRKLQLMHGAAGAKVITCGTFALGALRFARRSSLELIDGAGVLALLKDAPENASHHTAREFDTSFIPRPTGVETEDLQATEPPPGEAPQCPRCSSPMHFFTGMQGNTSGAKFWACSRFPTCKGTLTT